MTRGSMVLMKGLLVQGLYMLQETTTHGDITFIESKTNKTELWHKRMGHMSMKGLLELTRQSLLDKKHISNLQFCDNCIIGKAHRLKFVTTTHRTKGVLDYIYSDLWGSPMVTPSLSKCKYFLSFIDDYLRKLWLYFL